MVTGTWYVVSSKIFGEVAVVVCFTSSAILPPTQTCSLPTGTKEGQQQCEDGQRVGRCDQASAMPRGSGESEL